MEGAISGVMERSPRSHRGTEKTFNNLSYFSLRVLLLFPSAVGSMKSQAVDFGYKYLFRRCSWGALSWVRREGPVRKNGVSPSPLGLVESLGWHEIPRKIRMSKNLGTKIRET